MNPTAITQTGLNRRHRTQKLMWGVFGLSSGINLAALVIICGFLVIKGLPAISWSFLTEMPRDSMRTTPVIGLTRC